MEVKNQKLTKKYLQSLDDAQRKELIQPIFDILRAQGFTYPDEISKLKDSYQKICQYQPDLNNIELYNNSSLGTDICKYFCRDFYHTTETNKKTIQELWQDDQVLFKLIANRLGLDWYYSDNNGPGVNEAFNLSFKMFCQGMRSMRLITQTSIFKPCVAKYLTLKYSQEGDTIFDYSAGFGARLMGATSCNRKYIGTDPLTTPDLFRMAEYLQLTNYTLLPVGSENYRGEENSVDFSYSSPPYFSMEKYSNDLTQAYNQGEEYFYDIYWKQTLDNIKYMLKPGKWFGFNILEKYTKMIEMVKNRFGKPVEIIKLKTVRSHLSKTGKDDAIKFEPVFMFRNNK